MRNPSPELRNTGMKRLQQLGPMRITTAAVLLGLGSLFVQLGLFFNNLGRLCARDSTMRTWAAAINSIRHGRINSNAPEWEQRLLRVGPSVVTSVMSTLALLWMGLFLGGALFWLALHGYGFLLLLGAILTGVVIGIRRARLSQHLPQHDSLN